MMERKCKGKTAAGEACAGKPGKSGYCAAHAPAQLARRKALEGQKARLGEVLDSVITTAKAKGWHADISSQDKQGWKYASVSVSRSSRRLSEN